MNSSIPTKKANSGVSYYYAPAISPLCSVLIHILGRWTRELFQHDLSVRLLSQIQLCFVIAQ
jgi:hypothetical protein